MSESSEEETFTSDEKESPNVAPKKFGKGAHRTAATFQAKEHHRCLMIFAFLFRLLETVSQIGGPIVLAWNENPFVALPLLLCGMYLLPAVFRERSFLKVLQDPILCLFPSHCSLLALKRGPKDARRWYFMTIVRTAIILKWTLHVRFSRQEPYSQLASKQLMATYYLGVYFQPIPLHKFSDVVLGIVMFSQIMYMTLVPLLLCCCKGVRGQEDTTLLAQIEHEAQYVEEALARGIGKGEAIQDEETGKKLNTVSWMIWIAVFFFFLDILSDINTIFTFMMHGRYVAAGLLGASIMLSSAREYHQTGGGNVLFLLREAYWSVQQGVYTDKYLATVENESSVEALPSLMISLFVLPLTVDNLYEFYTGILSIVLSAGSIAKFATTEFDLGIECMGEKIGFLEPEQDKLAESESEEENPMALESERLMVSHAHALIALKSMLPR